MKVISGTFNGTGAALYICCGFVPDFVKLWNLEDTDESVLIWNKHMARTADMLQGLRYVGSSGATQQSPLTTGGIEPYFGGERLTSAMQTSATYGAGVYLSWDNDDYRTAEKDAALEEINAWTLDNENNRTGHFNGDVTGTYIGEGSPIFIDGKKYYIVALTAGQGSAANEVTLSQAAKSGRIERIGGMYDLSPIPLGRFTPDGFKINATDVINVSGETVCFEAGIYD